MKQEVPSPEKEKENSKVNKNETPQKTPIKKSPEKKTPTKKTPAKKKTPKTNDKAKSKKASPIKSAFSVKTEKESPVKVKAESPAKEKTDESTSKTEVKEEKPIKINPFFTKQKDLKLQSSEELSNGASYDPGKSNYHPIKDCFWKHGEKYVYDHFLGTKYNF